MEHPDLTPALTPTVETLSVDTLFGENNQEQDIIGHVKHTSEWPHGWKGVNSDGHQYFPCKTGTYAHMYITIYISYHIILWYIFYIMVWYD